MSTTPEAAHTFDDSEAYERFMGSWSRAATPIFLEWMSAPRGARWLDLGCGTGILAENILASARAVAVDAVDPAPAQVEHAARRLRTRPVRFHVAQAEALPFSDDSFDVVASALVINFLRDRPRGLLEMHRVVRDGGIVGGFVWDFAAERSPSWPMRQALRAIGVAVPQLPGTGDSGIDALRALFAGAGFDDIATRTFEVTVSFRAFEDFWLAQTPSYSPTTRTIEAMGEAERSRLKQAVRAALPVNPVGAIAYFASANAIKAVAAKLGPRRFF